MINLLCLSSRTARLSKHEGNFPLDFTLLLTRAYWKVWWFSRTNFVFSRLWFLILEKYNDPHLLFQRIHTTFMLAVSFGFGIVHWPLFPHILAYFLIFFIFAFLHFFYFSFQKWKMCFVFQCSLETADFSMLTSAQCLCSYFEVNVSTGENNKRRRERFVYEWVD